MSRIWRGSKQGLLEIEKVLGGVDILVNNAGWDLFRPFLKTDPEFWRKIIDINLIGALNMHHVVLPGMVERGYGRVVSVFFRRRPCRVVGRVCLCRV
ncbi:MAG: hypothetical protein Ct9H300mP14_09820 [Gammaproteobacteria bacterium]|nr:MAG: hypothetical protein Ct9H300mP14_09820 [Gammaproteobacteria bacterium]